MPGPKPYGDDNVSVGKSQKSEYHRQVMYDKLANVKWEVSDAEDGAMVFPYGNQNKYYDKKMQDRRISANTNIQSPYDYPVMNDS